MKVSLGEKLISWAEAEAAVEMIALIGSRTRATGQAAAADSHSDWDFQLITSRPELFADRAWTGALGETLLAYVARPGRLGSARKVTALFSTGEVDLVVLPAAQVRAVHDLVRAGQHAANPPVMQGLTDLAAVLQGGYRILKGDGVYGEFYRFVAAKIPPPRLSDADVRNLADGFVCDYVSTRHKIERGEFLAAQRWLHHQLAEVNFQLLHELRQRMGQASFPDARRLESLAAGQVGGVTVDAAPNAAALGAAVEKSAATCRRLMRELVGEAWQWPELPGTKDVP